MTTNINIQNGLSYAINASTAVAPTLSAIETRAIPVKPGERHKRRKASLMSRMTDRTGMTAVYFSALS